MAKNRSSYKPTFIHHFKLQSLVMLLSPFAIDALFACSFRRNFVWCIQNPLSWLMIPAESKHWDSAVVW